MSQPQTVPFPAYVLYELRRPKLLPKGVEEVVLHEGYSSGDSD